MILQLIQRVVSRRAGLLTACVTLAFITQLAGAGKGPSKARRYDPVAEKMDLFPAIEAGALAARVVANDSKGGSIFFENLSNKPLTINLPESAVMVHVLRQVGNGNLFGNNGNGSGANGQQQPNQAGGGAQNLGSGFGQQGTGSGVAGNGANGPTPPIGNGFFSIAPQRVFQLPFQSVCLNYGQPDPSPRMTYQLVPVESYTEDRVLRETLCAFAYGRTNQVVIQAAAWHVANKLSWDELAGLTTTVIPGVQVSQVPIFSRQQLYAARELVAPATQRAVERAKSEQNPKSDPATPATDGKTTSASATK